MISKYKAARYNKCSFLDEHVYLCLLCYKWLYFSISQKWLIAADVERIRELLWCVICCCWIFLIQTENVVRKVWTKNKIKKMHRKSNQHPWIYKLYTHILMLFHHNKEEQMFSFEKINCSHISLKLLLDSYIGYLTLFTNCEKTSWSC